MENVDVNNKSKIVKLMISVIILIVIALVGTYALTIWRSQENTELTLRIGDISGFYCTKGDNIEINNIGPIFDYTIDGESATFSVDNQTNETAKVTVKFHVTTITDNLKEESFKYVLMTNTDNSSYTVYTEGNFKDVSSNSNIVLLDNYGVGLSSKVLFKLVIYIDGNMENPITMQGGSLVGYLDACKEKPNLNTNIKLDSSGANRPILVDGLIPVVYKQSKWVRADVSNDTVTATCNALGDVDGDGLLSSNDSLYVKGYIGGGRTFTNEQKVCADVDRDGIVTNADAEWIMKGSVGKKFPKEEMLSAVEGTVRSTPFDWYDYDTKQWANAVLVTDINRYIYLDAEPGTEVAEADILAFYVWIPRYKYKVWNINKVIGTDSYNAQTTGIDIVFEDGTSSTGTISCTYSYEAPSSTAGSPNETCTGSNGDYYTHPAFTFGEDELKGFWMGKFELSSETPNVEYGGGNSVILTPRILPNVTSWKRNNLSNYWKVIYDMQTSNNIYGLPTSRTNTDSHMITNMEWGAVAYLTNSKYGRCTNESCTEVTINNCNTNITGIGGDTVSASKSSTTCATDENKYDWNGQLASTTDNIYGVYDMSGGAAEYVMGNISSESGNNYIYNAGGVGSNFTYNTNTLKYLTTYAYGATSDDQTAYNRGRLGDATSETTLKNEKAVNYSKNKEYVINNLLFIETKKNSIRFAVNIEPGGNDNITAWYTDFVHFPGGYSMWIERGGSYEDETNAGLFSTTIFSGNFGYGSSTRAILAPLS